MPRDQTLKWAHCREGGKAGLKSGVSLAFAMQVYETVQRLAACRHHTTGYALLDSCTDSEQEVGAWNAQYCGASSSGALVASKSRRGANRQLSDAERAKRSAPTAMPLPGGNRWVAGNVHHVSACTK
jgi:hypothetical protein